MKRQWKSGLFLLIAVFIAVLFASIARPSKAIAVNPTTMSFQGKVVKADGTNVTDGTYTFLFKLYSVSSAGASLWSETQSTVTVAGGTFQVNLGSVCPLFTANACNGSTPIDFSTASSLYLGITFNNDAAGEMTPRVQMQSVPFAYQADNASSLGGRAASGYVQLSPSSQQTGTINLSGSGTFGNGLTVSTGGVTIGSFTSSGVVHSSAVGLLSNSAVVLGTETSGNYVASLGTLTGLTTTGNGTASSTPTLSVTYGSSANMAVQGNTALVCPSGTGNITGTGNTITLGTGGTCNSLAIVNNPTFTGLITGQSGTTGLALSGAPVAGTGVSSLLQLGGTIAGGNSVANGGTYLGINEPAAGAGSAADFANFQLNGISKLKIANSGAITAAGALTISSGGVAVTGNSTIAGDVTVSSGSINTSNLGISFNASATNPTCTAADYKLFADSVDGQIKRCVAGTVSNVQTPDIRSFVSSTAVALVSANSTTSYWRTAAENNNVFPNLTPTGTDKEIFGIATMEITSNTNNDLEVTTRVEVSTTSGKACNTGTAVGGRAGTFSSNTGTAKTSSTTFVYNPASTTKQYFNFCSDAATNSTLGTVSRIRITLYEVNDSNADLAEVYPTNDKTLHNGELVSLDSSILNGVKRSAPNDKQLMGVISSDPALVIGGKGEQGANGVPVALTGRVPARVSTENGAIKAGDALTVSSTSGVAMKAIKAGPMLGMAMEDYSGSGTGTVMTFIKPGYYSGGSLSDSLNQAGLSTTVSDISSSTLQYFIAHQADTLPSLSEIVTDRVAAGLEIITPKVTTDIISVAHDANLNGDVHVGGTLYADSIKSSQLDGLDVLKTDVQTLKQQAGIKTVASSVDTSAVQPTGPTQVSVTTAGQPTLQFSFDQTAATLNGMLNVSDLSVANGFTVGGDSNFGGLSSFQKLATFFAKAVFKQDVQFQGHITVANDSAGYAHIRKTESEVHVTFAKPYDKDPIVAATPANGAFASYSVKNIAKDGFDIVVPTSSDQDLLFSWTANGIVAPVTSENPKNEAVTTTP